MNSDKGIPQEKLTYQIEGEKTAPRLIFTGRLCLDAVTQAREIIDPILHSKPEKIQVDLTRLSYMDSAGLGIIIWMWNQLGSVRERLIIQVQAGGYIEDLLKVSHADTLVTLESQTC